MSSNLVFPSEIGEQSYRPVISFTVRSREGNIDDSSSIFFPCPENIAFSQSGAYGSISISTGTKLITDAVKSFRAGKDVSGIVNAGSNAVKGTISQLKESVTLGEAASTAADAVPFVGDNAAAFLNFDRKAISNPRVNSTFEGNNVRTFAFSFNLIASTREESETIKKISERFRYFTYAKENGLGSLSYPPTWNIKFLQHGQENPFIPKIFDCYLESAEMVINDGGNIFHEDGAPNSVTISLSFQESKVLTRDEMIALDEGRSIRNDGGTFTDYFSRNFRDEAARLTGRGRDAVSGFFDSIF